MIGRLLRWIFRRPPSIAEEQRWRREQTAERVHREQYTVWEWPHPSTRYEVGVDLADPLTDESGPCKF